MISDKRLKKFQSKHDYEKNVIEWQLFYLNNLDIFNTEFLGLKSKFFQKQVINTCWENDITFINASRGLSKSYTIGNIAIDFALLMPNIKIGIASLTIAQSNKIINEKIDKIFTMGTNQLSSDVLVQLRKDNYIEFKTDGLTDGKIVKFGNGSEIFAVSSGESGRGTRLNMIIADEVALIKKTQYYANLEPMLEPYNFYGIMFEPKQFFLTSSRTKDNWCWDKLLEIVTKHYKNDTGVKYGFFAGDIFTSVANKIHSKKQYLSRKETTTEFEFAQEYLNIWQGEAEGGLFNYEQFRRLQIIDDAFIPISPEDMLFNKKQTYDFYQDIDDVRVLACDIALAGGDENDNTVIILGKVNLKTGLKTIEYITAFNGVNSIDQARKIKRLFYQYKSSYAIIDTKGLGNAIYDILTTPLEDSEMMDSYPAWTVTSDKDLNVSSNSVIEDKKNRTLYDNAEEVIVAYTGTLELNSTMHIGMQKALKDKNIRFLIDNYEKDYKNSENEEWLEMSSKERARQLAPFIETNFMINESVALQSEYRNGLIRVTEKRRTDYKDRYMTMAMFNLLCDKILNRNIKVLNGDGEFDVKKWKFLSR